MGEREKEEQLGERGGVYMLDRGPPGNDFSPISSSELTRFHSNQYAKAKFTGVGSSER